MPIFNVVFKVELIASRYVDADNKELADEYIKEEVLSKLIAQSEIGKEVRHVIGRPEAETRKLKTGKQVPAWYKRV